ncbi:acyl-ACP--UDP-N-acetylglucosamine O-acyltransferase [Phenylobacterium sp. LH3H17]|uniref:acyl-ACP--UDP-N-acetylglucosamine O-acyltransferase n=1 Tax=Phenylobacterium sp. LH3H17 TaxID=2903901 RepID=UPI0020C96643|nr:acyl-ACP--UDP-N-acetylglucosamine O-acyltransferase [Phenylobacterium sp. LH3H17]UTP37764.1 acyl-ACP--UDP-N-acetylglucosamine O-acyltransferase [Phenylobacterium sp. LH3H17]
MSRIHPTAIVDPDARLGEACDIGPYAVIGAGVRMGPSNIVGPHAVIEGETRIGTGNRFSQACSIGAGPQIAGWAGSVGRVIVGDGNVFREFVTVHGSALEATVVGSRNLIMSAAHIAHDCRLGDEVKIANGSMLGGAVEVGDSAWVSGLCAVHQNVRIGRHAFVAGGSIVTQDVPPFCLVQGDRARLVSLNLVGLRRAGFSPADVLALRRAYRTLFRGSASLAERLTKTRQIAEGAAAELLDFIECSSRGTISASRRRAA